MTRKGKRYKREFQLNAARMVVEEGYSRAEVAKKLGTTAWSVSRWISRFQASGELGAEPEEGASETEALSVADELRKLRKQVDELQVENEILKKATAYFAKESR